MTDILLSMYTIYENPKDRPAGFGPWFAVRRFEVKRAGYEATSEVTWHNSLAEARVAVPPGLVHIARLPDDDPCIVEVWF